MNKAAELFVREAPDYTSDASVLFISSNLFQNLEFPKEYPALIQVHMEHPAMSVPMHWHPGPELIYSRNKCITIYIDGEKHTLMPGDFTLISSFAVHAVEPSEDNIHQDILSVTFQAKYLEQMFPQMRSSHISLDAPGATEESRQQMCGLLEELRKNVELQEKHFVTNKLLFEILSLMYEDFYDGEQDGNVKRLATRNKMMEVLNYIDKNFRQPLTTQMVADHFGYTREYFCRMFKQYGEYTFKKYLTDTRLAAATHELSISNRSVGFIALDNGFPDEKSFFTAFKKRYGMTPVQYRHQFEKENKS
jgi:AraC-like DNA-binding protein/quercetin dioxygenase-like cupin family protein